MSRKSNPPALDTSQDAGLAYTQPITPLRGLTNIDPSQDIGVIPKQVIPTRTYPANTAAPGNVVFQNVTEVRNIYVRNTNYPGGNTNEVQISRNGSFVGDTEFKYNPTTNSLELLGAATITDIYATNYYFSNGITILSKFNGLASNAYVTTQVDQLGSSLLLQLATKPSYSDFANVALSGDFADLANVPESLGSAGSSAYEIAVTNGFSGTENQWLASLVGEKGDQGDPGQRGATGAQGVSVTLVGSVNDSTVLPEEGSAGQGYITLDSGNLWFWNTLTTSWNDIGQIVGPQGDEGLPGIKGDTGDAGIGIAVGGTTGQVLAKVSDTDYDTSWVTPFSGDYTDLSNTPTIPVYMTDLDNNVGFVTSGELAPVATSGSYNDLTDKPIIDDTTSLTGGDFFIAKDETTIQLGQWAAQAITIGSNGIQLSSDTVLLTTTDNISTTHLLLDSESGASLTTNHNIEISAGNGATLAYNIWLDAETLWEVVREEDASIIAPGTRTWAGLPSYEAYPLLMQFLPNIPNGEIPPASNMAPTAKTASDAYVAWQEELAATSVAVSAADNTWFFKADGTLTVPGSITMNERLTLNSVGVESGYTAAVLADGNLGRVFVRTLGGEDATLHTWEFNKEGQLMLPFGGDIVDNAGQSVLGGGGAANTGDITFVNNSIIGTADVIIGFDQVASPAVTFSFTENGIFRAPVIETSSIEVNGATIRTTSSVECLPNVDTVVYTSSSDLTATIKALFQVDGYESEVTGYDAQSCEMMVAQMGTRVSGSVYGLAYTSNAPLATFNARWNSNANLIEILCRPASTTASVYVRTTATEMLVNP